MNLKSKTITENITKHDMVCDIGMNWIMATFEKCSLTCLSKWPHPLWHEVSVWGLSLCRFQVLCDRYAWIFIAKHYQRAKISKMPARWFSDTFYTHFTSYLKRPSIKGLQGTGLSKYPHHHCRLQVSSHVSISNPPLSNRHICPPELSSKTNLMASWAQDGATPGLTCPQMFALFVWRVRVKLMKSGVGHIGWVPMFDPIIWYP